MTENVRLNLNEVNVLEVCCKVEETFADLYRYFSTIYADNLQACKLWSKTAMEEDAHAEQFRFACRLLGSGMQTLKNNLNEVNTVLTKVQNVFENVQKSPPTFIEALELAITLENALASYHMEAIVTFDDLNLAKLFTSMMNCDKEHIKSLERIYDKLSQC
jgi:rubrerythrin